MTSASEKPPEPPKLRPYSHSIAVFRVLRVAFDDRLSPAWLMSRRCQYTQLHSPGGFVMRTTTKIAAVVAAAGAIGFSSAAADAAPRCRAPVEGAATATGILGAGSAKARVQARANWQATARSLYGPGYASFWNAQGKEWDCKKKTRSFLQNASSSPSPAATDGGRCSSK